jgi:DNA-binding response OmpR family regulator
MAKILLVEDHAELRGLMSEYLKKHGYEVLTADDGWTALHSLKDQEPDLVVLDIGLPRLDGLRLLELVAQFNLKRGTEFLLLTGQREKKLVLRAIKLGACDYLTKPFELSELTRRIELYLRLLSPEEVKAVVLSLESPTTDTEGLSQISEVATGDWLAYRTNHEGRSFCVLLPKKKTPKQIKATPEERLLKEIRVYESLDSTWKIVWPAKLPKAVKKAA